MLRIQAEKAARQMMMSEYKHHRYENELIYNNAFLRLERDAFLTLINSSKIDDAYTAYVDVLGPTRLRSLKNSLICFIEPLCRLAINMGLNPEFSFGLSDFYINHLESIQDEKKLIELLRHIALHYYDLVQQEEMHQFTKPIARAVRYIKCNLYNDCSVADVANYVGLERHYFSVLFSKQVGIPPAKYILMCKLEAGRRILSHTSTTVAQVAEALAFYDSSHFSRRFKEVYGILPSSLSKRDEVADQVRQF